MRSKIFYRNKLLFRRRSQRSTDRKMNLMTRQRQNLTINNNCGGNERSIKLQFIWARAVNVKQCNLLGQITPQHVAVINVHEFSGNKPGG